MKFQPLKAAATLFGYNAIENLGRRQAPRTIMMGEDIVLPKAKREKLQATAREQYRNLSLLAWMVRRHIDYVSKFDFHIRTGIPGIDDTLAMLFEEHSRKNNFDIAGRHDRNSALRLFEAGKVLDGDALFLKLDSGHLQAIEADRVTKPTDINKLSESIAKRLTDFGLILDEYGKVEKYCITKRGDSGKDHNYEALVDADSVIYDGYFYRFDQTRGISPLASALNTCQDLYEGWEWTLLKIKLHALFGVAVKHESPEGYNYNKVGYADATETQNTGSTPYEFTLQKGIMSLDLEPGDSVDTIESKTPSAEFIEYSDLMTRVTLLALDIPFTAYNSMKSSFSARIADRAEYEESARDKRAKNQDVLRQYSDWKIDGWIDDKSTGLEKMMTANGISKQQLKYAVEWIPAGTPWLDKVKEVSGDSQALAIGADSTPRICKRRGLDAWKLVDEQAEYLAYAKAKNVPIFYGFPGQTSTNPQDNSEEINDEIEVDDESK